MTRQAGRGAALPLASSGSTASATTALRTSRQVGSPISTSTGLGGRLQPRGGVHGVADHRRVLAGQDHLAGRDPDPGGETDRQALVQRLEPLVHLDRRPHRSQSVVLVGERHAEHGHDRVADEFLARGRRGARRPSASRRSSAPGSGGAVPGRGALPGWSIRPDRRRAPSRSGASRTARRSPAIRRTPRRTSRRRGFREHTWCRYARVDATDRTRPAIGGPSASPWISAGLWTR